jgi:hypothetical protein
MLDRVDRMLVAVRDRAAAAGTFERLLGTVPDREAASALLAARASVLRLGESEVELWQPEGTGPVADFLARWGEGLFAAGYASARLEELAARLDARGVRYDREAGRLHLPGTATAGFPMVISPLEARPRAPGPVSFLYEATNALDSDWRAVAQRYVDLFGLDASRFSPIASERFGYEGTLTLFDPPARLDRIELSQTFADRPGAMRRFVEKRGGDALYMCYCETHDFEGLKRRLIGAGAPPIPRAADLAREHDNFWVHPKHLHGMLLGVSRTTLAWEWSGRPERVRQAG